MPLTPHQQQLLSAYKQQPHNDSHYRRGPVQPIDLILSQQLTWIEGEVIAAIVRWRHKNGIDDLRKAQGLLDLLVQLESPPPLQAATPDTAAGDNSSGEPVTLNTIRRDGLPPDRYKGWYD